MKSSVSTSCEHLYIPKAAASVDSAKGGEMWYYVLLRSSLADLSVTGPPEVNKNTHRFVEGWR